MWGASPRLLDVNNVDAVSEEVDRISVTSKVVSVAFFCSVSLSFWTLILLSASYFPLVALGGFFLVGVPGASFLEESLRAAVLLVAGGVAVFGTVALAPLFDEERLVTEAEDGFWRFPFSPPPCRLRLGFSPPEVEVADEDFLGLVPFLPPPPKSPILSVKI